MLKSHPEIVKLWPRTLDLARDLELPDQNVRQWVSRGTIPCKYWEKLVLAAKTRGYPVSLELLAHLAAKAA